MDKKDWFYNVNDYLKLPRDKEAWLLKPLLPVGGAALIYGDAKLGKSYLGIQLASALTGEEKDWLGFPVNKTGKVLYLQMDTPRSVWGERFDKMLEAGVKINDKLFLADRETVEFFPFDVLQPGHYIALKEIVHKHNPIAVIFDTLREMHSGDEDKSTVARNVIANLTDSCGDSAIILISHGRKPNPEVDKDMLADHRGSSYIVGKMDAIIRLTKHRLYYTGRSIEAGDIRIERLDNGLWAPIKEDYDIHLAKVMADPNLKSTREKARALAKLIGKSEGAAMSLMMRLDAAKTEVVNRETGEVIEVKV